MGWFLKAGFGVQGWNAKWSGAIATEWMKPNFYIEMARALERGGFDYLMIEDSSMINDTFEGSMRTTLARAAGAPKSDPMPPGPADRRWDQPHRRHRHRPPAFTRPSWPPASAPPWTTSPRAASASTSLPPAAIAPPAQNYGLDRHIEHDKRYRMADEWMEVVSQLWESWESDAVQADSESGIYADFSKVHPIDFEGEFFKVRGPMNTIPGPQRRPVLCQAGGSPAGRDLAAKHADTIVASANGVDAMREFQADVEERLAKFGRSTRDCKTIYLISPVLGADPAPNVPLFISRVRSPYAPAWGGLQRLLG